jgi:hypothetical protein
MFILIALLISGIWSVFGSGDVMQVSQASPSKSAAESILWVVQPILSDQRSDCGTDDGTTEVSQNRMRSDVVPEGLTTG